MRQNSIRPEATFIRIVCVVLFALGIALVDLSVVWAHTPTSSPAWHASGSLESHAPGRFAAGDATPLDASAGSARSGTRQILSGCFTSDCRPGTSLMATSRPHAAIGRFAGRMEADALQPADPHLHHITLLALQETSAPVTAEPGAASAPQRPARVAGADGSIPRPPPV